MNTKMIDVAGLSFSYGRKKSKVLDNFSMSLEKGAVYGLLGKNGTGKSTLFYLMAGLLRPQTGKVLYKGVEVVKREPSTLQDMFLVPEEFALPNVSLKQYVKLNAPFYPSFSEEILKACLRDFDMNEDIHLGELSMGQKKKAFMCFALATNTSLLMMDEPSNGLDIPSKAQLRRLIAENASDDQLIIISTHQVKDLENLIDPIIIMDKDGVVMNASIEEITGKLSFTIENEKDSGALFVQQDLRGYYTVRQNFTGIETPVDLEVLFNCALVNKALFREMFNNNRR